MLYVKNSNAEDYTGTYGGVKLSFPAGKWVAVDPSAANIIFGFGEDRDKDVIMRHFGVMPSTEYPKALAWLENFQFAEGDAPPKG